MMRFGVDAAREARWRYTFGLGEHAIRGGE
jgi:hypothetical protein